MTSNQITVVINTFKSEEKINLCLDSIGPNYKVIIIENSSSTDFKKKIEANYQNVTCYLTGENLGYAKGNNMGLSKVESQYALVLNPDATLGNNTLENFLKFAEKKKDFSIIGPAQQDENVEEDLNKDKEQLFEVNFLKGFAMFINMDQVKNFGFFDENFFIYLEEIDLCKRLRKANKKIFLDKNIIVNHLGGSSHDKSINYQMELSRNWHWMWSTFYFNKKHYGYLFALISVSGKFFSAFAKVIFYSLILNNKKRKIYFQRLSGLFNSIIGKKSWYRPNILND